MSPYTTPSVPSVSFQNAEVCAAAAASVPVPRRAGLGLGCDGHHGRTGSKTEQVSVPSRDWSKLRSNRLAPSKDGDVARSLSLNLPQLRFHEGAEDRQGEAARAESRRRRPASSRQPADTNRAVPGVVTPGELVNVHVGQFPADQPQPQLDPSLRFDQAHDEIVRGEAGLEPRTRMVQDICDEVPRRLRRAVNLRPEGPQMMFLVSLRPHAALPSRLLGQRMVEIA